jgi:hypothetical protein
LGPGFQSVYHGLATFDLPKCRFLLWKPSSPQQGAVVALPKKIKTRKPSLFSGLCFKSSAKVKGKIDLGDFGRLLIAAKLLRPHLALPHWPPSHHSAREVRNRDEPVRRPLLDLNTVPEAFLVSVVYNSIPKECGIPSMEVSMRMNWTRVILGGIVAGIVSDILGYVVDGVMLGPQWAGMMKALGKAEFSVSQNVAFSVIGLVYGIFMVWLYAAIRPRYGAGPKTAVCAGLAVWAAGTLLPNAWVWAAGLFPTSLTVMTTAAAIVELVVAALAGAAFYKEGAESV